VSETILPGTRRGGDGKSNGPMCKGSVAGGGLGTAGTIGRRAGAMAGARAGAGAGARTGAGNTDAGSELGGLNLGLPGAEATLLSSSGSASTAPSLQLIVVTIGGPRGGPEPPGTTGGRSSGRRRPHGGGPARWTAVRIAVDATGVGTLGRGLGAEAAANWPSPARPTGTRAVRRAAETTAVEPCRVRAAPDPKATGALVDFLDAFPGGLDAALPEGLKARFRDWSPPAITVGSKTCKSLEPART
jgi:hypothetical protein